MADLVGHPVAGDDGSVINIPPNSIPDVIRNAPYPGQNVMHTIKRGEEEVQVTTEQLKVMAQKGWNADVTTQQAREQAKQNEADIRLAGDLRAVIETGDVDAFRRMGLEAGVRGAELEEIVQQTFGEEEEVEEAPVRTAPQTNGQLDFRQFPKDVQRLLLRAEKGRISEIVQGELDKSEKIAYNLEQYDAKGRAAIRSLIDEKIRVRLADTNGDFGDGRFIMPGVLKDIEALLEAMNSPTRKVPPLGVGPAPGGDGLEVYPKKLPDHVSSASGGQFEQNVLETLAYHHANAQRSR
jgi:hypothetical protein